MNFGWIRLKQLLKAVTAVAGIQESLWRCPANAHTDQKPSIPSRWGGKITSWVTGLWQLCGEGGAPPPHPSSPSVRSQREASVTVWQLSLPPLALTPSSSTNFHIITSHRNLLSPKTWGLLIKDRPLCIRKEFWCSYSSQSIHDSEQ